MKFKFHTNRRKSITTLTLTQHVPAKLIPTESVPSLSPLQMNDTTFHVILMIKNMKTFYLTINPNLLTLTLICPAHHHTLPISLSKYLLVSIMSTALTLVQDTVSSSSSLSPTSATVSLRPFHSMYCSPSILLGTCKSSQRNSLCTRPLSYSLTDLSELIPNYFVLY